MMGHADSCIVGDTVFVSELVVDTCRHVCCRLVYSVVGCDTCIHVPTSSLWTGVDTCIHVPTTNSQTHDASAFAPVSV
jgi:hypothetical protein